MVFIKKKLIITFSAALVFLMSACSFSLREPAPPCLELSAAPCSVEYSGMSAEVKVTSSGGRTTISFDEPESLSGLVYTFEGGGCKISLGDLCFETEKTRLDRCALPQLLSDILSDARSEDALTLLPDSNGESAQFAGEIYGTRYIIKSDRETGRPQSLSCRGLSLDAAFE